MPSNMVEVHQRLHIYANESKHKNSVYVSWLIGDEEERGGEGREERKRSVSFSPQREERSRQKGGMG